jgi:hypothetical protein
MAPGGLEKFPLTRNFQGATLDPQQARQRADINRARSLLAKRELHRLLELALDPMFTGTIAVELSAKEGRLGQPKVSLIRWPADE